MAAKKMKYRIFTGGETAAIQQIPMGQPGRKRFQTENERRKHMNEIRNRTRSRRENIDLVNVDFRENFSEEDVICKFDLQEV